MKKQASYVSSYQTNLNHYTAQAFIVRCFDDRFRGAFEKFLKVKKILHADFESVAGGAKIFASPERKSDREFMIRELEKSIKLHKTRRVILLTHTDCGAYGGLARFGGDAERQDAFHRGEHKKAREVIKIAFPNLPVETYFIDLRGIIKTSSS